jgi:Sec-independent protein secretion pathway component TatC
MILLNPIKIPCYIRKSISAEDRTIELVSKLRNNLIRTLFTFFIFIFNVCRITNKKRIYQTNNNLPNKLPKKFPYCLFLASNYYINLTKLFILNQLKHLQNKNSDNGKK